MNHYLKAAGLLVSYLFIQPFVLAQQWELIDATGKVSPRHEAGLVGYQSQVYLLGGRGIKHLKPTDVYNIKTNVWQKKSAPPFEIHHFQAVEYKNNIYFIGAMTGRFPNEVPLENILIYNIKKDQWITGSPIPKARRRGGAGVSIYHDKMYISGGITHGHMTGTVAWFDEYDPQTGKWRALADMPNGRDHFQSAVIGHKLYAAGGRRTSKKTNQLFDLVVNNVNIYDFKKQKWLSEKVTLPTARAGNTTAAINGNLWVIGGESMQKTAHNEVEIFNVSNKTWSNGPSLVLGRHGTGVTTYKGYLYTISGSGGQGGSPELKNFERLLLK